MTDSQTSGSSWLNNRTIIELVALACLIGPAAFVVAAHYGYHTDGFPLDDAWIYQVYARNLAHSGQWAFIAGQPSTGSTSVLWTLLIAPAYLLGIDGRLWTLGLGALALFATAIGAVELFAKDRPLIQLFVGLSVALEWHLVWAAASGMETMLFAALLMWFWVWVRGLARDPGDYTLRDGLLLGVWGGALALARPEGIVAFAVGAVWAGLAIAGWRGRLQLTGSTVLGLAILIAPWLAFNYATSGAIWPNTFAAKQAEYAPLLALPYINRLAEQIAAVWVGPQLVLIPGVVIAVRQFVVRKPVEWVMLLPLMWVFCHLALYAARLPVTYQHARYAIPTISPLVAYGIHGLMNAIRPRSPHLIVRSGSIAWAATALILFPVFLFALGAPAYGRDSRFIQDEMVATAGWIEQNTRPADVIAVHDIGALGYFAPRPIVDLAGLVSPDVVGFMGDEAKLAEFIRARHARYLIVFPRWPGYDRLVARPGFCAVWSADQIPGYTQASDLGPMTIYAVDPSGECQ